MAKWGITSGERKRYGQDLAEVVKHISEKGRGSNWCVEKAQEETVKMSLCKRPRKRSMVLRKGERGFRQDLKT